MRIRFPEDIIPGGKDMSSGERARWSREWKKLIWKRTKYRWVFGVSFGGLLVILGGIVAPAFLTHSHKIQDKILLPIWALFLSAMLAHQIQYLASRGEMKSRIEDAHSRVPR